MNQSTAEHIPVLELRHRHSFGLPARCYELIEITDHEQLTQIDWSADTLILGEGTNTLFVEDFCGRVLVNKLQGITITETESAFLVRAQAGENWHQFVLDLNARNIFGLENLALIPGTVGAAPVQNIGAYGVEAAQFIDAVEAWDFINNKTLRWSRNDCEFGYRMSKFKRPEWRHILITAVHFSFPKAWQPVLNYKELSDLPGQVTALQIMQRVIEVRQKKLPDPEKLANAGSFFKNPSVGKSQAQQLSGLHPNLPMYPQAGGEIKLAAGWLIEQAGLKGFQCGGAAVHENQALVLVNKGGATGADVQELAKHIQDTIFKTYQVKLEPEVLLITAHGLAESL